MLTFTQFLAEADRVDHNGFLHAKTGKPIIGNYENDAEDTHDAIAVKHKLSTHKKEPGADAVRKGHVRYYHHYSDKEAGYSFLDTPKARKAVSDHLGRSGGFRKIFIDRTHPKTGTNTSHEFRSTEEARNHLDRL